VVVFKVLLPLLPAQSSRFTLLVKVACVAEPQEDSADMVTARAARAAPECSALVVVLVAAARQQFSMGPPISRKRVAVAASMAVAALVVMVVA
jgi:hypothetical protein